MEVNKSAEMSRYRKIGQNTFEEFIDMATLFHNYPAPGLLIGGYMVEEAKLHVPAGTLYEAISETSWCLPDAIQMLTPCTIGNGWMRVMNFGIYALSLFDKYTGEGIRVWLDYDKMPADSELRVWFTKSKTKKEQDSDKLREEIGMLGTDILSWRPVTVQRDLLIKRSKGEIAFCPSCGEGYPMLHGPVCRSCRGDSPYTDAVAAQSPILFPLPESVHAVSSEEALGKPALHDMTQIKASKSKVAAFRKDQVLGAQDLCRLQHMGRNNIYVQSAEIDEKWVHENDCAVAFAKGMAGDGVMLGDAPHEGKISLRAAQDGLLRVHTQGLYTFNLCPGVMAASRNGWTVVKKGTEIAATRAIPLYLERPLFDRAMDVLDSGPIFTVLPLKSAKAGVLITGEEVFSGKIEDRFEGIIRAKLAALGSSVHKTIIAPDKREAIAQAARDLLDAGCDLIVTTAGLSVDPDDVTRHGLVDAGAHDLVYGAPILPGAMALVGRIGKPDQARLLGVPACALFFKNTSLDLLLPRLLADVDITRDDLAHMGEGGMCLGCTNCTYPKCPFGK